MKATRIRSAASLDTRLGRFEVVDLLLWDDGAPTPCLGFRDAGTVLRVEGFACGTPGHPLGRAALACAIDRIDLVSAGDDAALRAVFVAAERQGGATCLARPSPSKVARASPRNLAQFDEKAIQDCVDLPTRSCFAAGTGSGHAPSWLDPDGEMPPLRGLIAATSRRR